MVLLRSDSTGSKCLNYFSHICLTRLEISFFTAEEGTKPADTSILPRRGCARDGWSQGCRLLVQGALGSSTPWQLCGPQEKLHGSTLGLCEKNRHRETQIPGERGQKEADWHFPQFSVTVILFLNPKHWTFSSEKNLWDLTLHRNFIINSVLQLGSPSLEPRDLKKKIIFIVH